ncbi:acyltransferase [Methylophilaceae bacterium]|nr:acyltransferase [Methylophilaceae bacterium]
MNNSLTLLRAIACLSVLLAHSVGILKDNFFIDFGIISAGHLVIGVDIFFVLSGYLMARTSYNKKISDFYISRFFRIVPLYWIVNFTYLFLVILFSKYISTTIDVESFVASLIFVHKLIYGLSPIINVGWTLEYEMLFYFIFGLVFVKNKGKKHLFTLFITMVVIAFIFKAFIVIEFLFGIIVFIVSRDYKTIIKKYDTYLLIVVFFLFIGTTFTPIEEITTIRFIVFGLPSFLIVLWASVQDKSYRYFVTLIGMSSYSIYLTHMIFLSIFIKIFNYYLEADKFYNIFLLILILLWALFLGILVYLFIEKPLNNFLKKYQPGIKNVKESI